MELRELSDHEIHVQSATMKKMVKRWVRDGQDVEDIIQETWLIALERQRERIQHLNRWLNGVARLRALRFYRSSANQRAREELSARPDLSPSTEEACARNDTLALLIRYIGRLDEPYRSILRGRYVDGLSIAELARCNSVTQATVRTQLHRGRVQLKDRWERSQGVVYGGWLTGWVMILWHRLRGTSPLRRWTVSFGMAATFVASVLIPLRAFNPEPERAGTLAYAAETESLPVQGIEPEIEPRIAPPLTTSATPVQHNLRVSCLWTSRKPARDVELTLERIDGRPFIPIKRPTDEYGEVFFDELESGLYQVRPPLGNTRLVSVNREEEVSIELVLPLTKSLTVQVEKGRAPYADAAVWLSYPNSPSRGRFVGRTDSDGKLEISHVTEGIWIGARTEEGLASDMQLYQNRSPIYLQLPNSPEVLHGRVLDDTRAPIAGAQVEVASMSDGLRHTASGIFARGLPTTTFSDEEGRFELPWWGATMHVLAKADGHKPQSYVLSARNARRCEFVLQRNLEVQVPLFDLSGVSLDADGSPLAGWYVYLTPQQAVDPLGRVLGLEPKGQRVVRTDRQGRFHIPNLPAGVQNAILVDPSDELQRIFASAQVRPEDLQELTLRSSSDLVARTIRGRVANAKECISLDLYLDGDALNEPIPFELDQEDQFALSDLLPGSYRLVCRRMQRPTQLLATCELGSEDADLGELTVRFFGSLRLRIDTPDGSVLKQANFMGAYEAWLLAARATERESKIRLEEGYLVADEIPAGPWRLGLYAPGFASAIRNVEIRVDEEATGTIELARGGPRALRFEPTRAFSSSDRIYYEIWNESRRSDFYVRPPAGLGAGSVGVTENLPHGALYLEARTDSGLVGRTFIGENEKEIVVALTPSVSDVER